jgi:hypothetical protein
MPVLIAVALFVVGPVLAIWATERLLEWWSLPDGDNNGTPGHA